MFVDISDRGVGLAEPDNFSQFHVRIAEGITDDAVDALLTSADAGFRDGRDQVAVKVAWLRATAPVTAADWTDNFEHMLTYAGSKGWLVAAGTAVLGHVVRA